MGGWVGWEKEGREQAGGPGERTGTMSTVSTRLSARSVPELTKVNTVSNEVKKCSIWL